MRVWTETIRRADPRYYQLVVLSSLLTYGIWHLDFPVGWEQVVGIFAVAMATQYVASRAVGIAFDPKSTLITTCSLCLLFRSAELWVIAAVAAMAIASKFLIRFRGKHIFNPANFGIVMGIYFLPTAWTTPGQWGSIAWFAFLMACLGMMVVTRAARYDISLAFLASYAALCFGRAFWMGDPLSIPVHQLQSGALLLFAFFMISDPKATPDARIPRMVFAVMVACFAFYLQFGLQMRPGLFFSLFLLTLLVPMMDWLWKAKRYSWATPHV